MNKYLKAGLYIMAAAAVQVVSTKITANLSCKAADQFR